MTIQLEAPTSRYTTTQTQTQRLAPLGRFEAADYVSRSQIDTLDNNWSALDQSFYALSPVSKATTDAYEKLHKVYADWRDTQVDLVNSRAPGLAAQQQNYDQAKGIYSAAVAAGAKPVAKAAQKVQNIVVPETITAGNAALYVVLGLAALLFVLPTREEPSRTALDMFPNTRRRSRLEFSGLSVKGPKGPVSGFGREKTKADFNARIRWENWAAKRARKDGHPELAVGHELTARAYYDEKQTRFKAKK